MIGKIYVRAISPLLLTALIMSGCGGNPKSNTNSIQPVIHNVGDGLTSTYAATLEQLEFAEPYNDVYMEIPENHVPAAGQFLAEFSTTFGSPQTTRAKNIVLAADSIDGKVVNPGEVFSFNEATGPTTKANGYRLARIFVRGIERKGFGGGVCQVSSTLYNTAVQAGMEIVERHPHSKEVHYVEKDKDAAVSYGSIDLQFKNTWACPVRINADVTGDHITVALYTA